MDELPVKNPPPPSAAGSDIEKKLRESAMLGVRSRVPVAQPASEVPAYAASLAHSLGLLPADSIPDPDLDQQLLADLESVGVDKEELRSAMSRLELKDRESLRLHALRAQFQDTLSFQRAAITSAFRSLDFNFKSVDGVRLNLLRQAQAVFLLFDAFEKNLEAAGDAVQRQTQALSANVQSLDGKFKALEQIAFDVDERALAMRESVRRAGAEVRGAGPASQRAAFYGAVLGSAAGAFFASVLLVALWVVLG